MKCYVNGKKVLSANEKEAAVKRGVLRGEYEKIKGELFNTVTSSIQEQIKRK